MTYQAVLFDMDGVVVDSERSVTEFWQDLARLEGYSLSGDDLEQHVYGRRAEHTLAELFPQISADRYDEVYARLKQNQQSLRYSAITGATTLLRHLRAADVPLALVTGAQPWKVTEVLGQLELTEIFQVLVNAEDVAAGKPDPAGYLLAAQRLAVPIGRCLVFEDAVSGVTSAVTAGATCVAVARPHRSAQVLHAGATTVVRDFEGVAFAVRERTLHINSTVEFSFSSTQNRRSSTAVGDYWCDFVSPLS
jgi:HAD superfamily hydrolase (TIGR01509 family)